MLLEVPVQGNILRKGQCIIVEFADSYFTVKHAVEALSMGPYILTGLFRPVFFATFFPLLFYFII